MSLMLFRAKIKVEHVAEVEAAARTVFAALEEAQPKGLHYASCKLADGVTFVILLGLEEGSVDPLPTLPAYREFLGHLKGWLAEPPSQEPLTVIGSYNLL